MLCVFPAKLLAAGSLGWLLLEEWVAQHFLKYRLKNLSSSCQLSIPIVRSVEQELRELVNHHVSWSGIKSDHIFRPGIGGDSSEVGDAADILHNTPDAAVSEDYIVERWNQRRAFASG